MYISCELYLGMCAHRFCWGLKETCWCLKEKPSASKSRKGYKISGIFQQENLFILSKNFYQSIVNLPGCDEICCTTKWPSHIYTYIHSLWLFSHIDYHGILSRVLCAIQQVPMDQSFLYLSVHMPDTNPCASLPPSPPDPFGNHKFLKICESFIFFRFHISCRWYNMMFVFHCLNSLSMTISSSIHVTANDIISLFFMAE